MTINSKTLLLLRLYLTFSLLTSTVKAQLFGPDVDTTRATFSLLKITDAVSDGYRLPNNTFPTLYTLTLTTNIHLDDETDPVKFQFDGNVEINLGVKETSNAITVHARQLAIKDAWLYEKNTEGVFVVLKQWTETDIFYNETTEFLTFTLNTGQELSVDKEYKLVINYSGTLRELAGFYRSSYLDETGKRRWLATTHFESTNARHAFPCYDEPGTRAPIKLSINHSPTYFAVSNMPVESETQSGSYTKTTFIQTPSMQTYLLAFVVSDFGYIEVKGDIPQRVLAQKQQIAQGLGDFGVRTGVKVLNHLESYFGIPYTKNNPKMDQIAIPDFSPGAMENWGLVTYRLNYLLFDEKADTTSTKHNIVSVIAHEYTHQYFGNLVSPVWWSYLWLNEGFATLYGNLAVTPIYPEFNDNELFVLENLQPAMTADALGTTRPMTYYVETPQAVGRLFDIIAYQKAGSVLRMLQNAVTEPVWHEGLINYLTNKQNQAANSDDLAEGLQTSISANRINLDGLTMKEIIDSWSLTAGVPLVEVTLNTAENQLVFTQSRFLTSPNLPQVYANNLDTWLIPLSIATASNPSQDGIAQKYLKEKQTVLSLNDSPRKWIAGDWVLVNTDGAGYYRVKYDVNLLKRLIDKLNSKNFQDINHFARTQLIDDSFALSKAGKLDFTTILELLNYLKQERHFLPWVTASRVLIYFNFLLADSANYELFSRFVQDLVTPLYQHYGNKDFGNVEPYGDKRAREIGISWACRTGEEKCIQEAKDRVNTSLKTGSRYIEPDLQYILYCAALRQGSDAEFQYAFKRVFTIKGYNQRQRIFTALGCTQNSTQQQIYLQSTIVEGSQSAAYQGSERNTVLNSVANNERGGVLNVIEFLDQNYEAVEKVFGTGTVRSRISSLAYSIASNKTFEKYQVLIQNAKNRGDLFDEEITILNGIVNLNFNWIEANDKEITSYLQELYKTSSSSTSVTVSSVITTIFCTTLLCII